MSTSRNNQLKLPNPDTLVEGTQDTELEAANFVLTYPRSVPLSRSPANSSILSDSDATSTLVATDGLVPTLGLVWGPYEHLPTLQYSDSSQLASYMRQADEVRGCMLQPPMEATIASKLLQQMFHLIPPNAIIQRELQTTSPINKSSSQTKARSRCSRFNSTPSRPKVGPQILQVVKQPRKAKTPLSSNVVATIQGDIDDTCLLITSERRQINNFDPEVFGKVAELLINPEAHYHSKSGFLYECQDLCYEIPRLQHIRTQQFVDRCNQEFNQIGGRHYVYYFNLDFKSSCVYIPQVVRTQVDKHGKLKNTTRAGLCSYCEESRFFDIKTSGYAQHMYLQHGILTFGTLVPYPLAHGKYYYRKPENVASKTKRHTMAKYHFEDAVLCPTCLIPLGIGCTGKTKDRPLVNYLRHYRDVHAQIPSGIDELLQGIWEGFSDDYESPTPTTR